MSTKILRRYKCCLFESGLVGIFLAEGDRIREANAKFLEIVAYSREDLARGLLDRRELTPPEYETSDKAGLAQLLQYGRSPLSEKEYIRKDGSRVPVAVEATLLDRESQTCLCMVADLTGRKDRGEQDRLYIESLEAIAREKIKRLKQTSRSLVLEKKRHEALSKKLVRILENERREMATALHNEAGQLLAGLKIHLELVDRTPELKAAIEMVKQLMRFISNLSHNLRPESLDVLGLVAALRILIDRFRAQLSGSEITFIAGKIPPEMDRERQIAVYRIAQEALTNCLKYADARNIEVKLLERGGAVEITVKDDGKGFDYEEIYRLFDRGRGPLGLMLMQERAQQLGGKFRIESSPGKGTVLAAIVPVRGVRG